MNFGLCQLGILGHEDSNQEACSGLNPLALFTYMGRNRARVTLTIGEDVLGPYVVPPHQYVALPLGERLNPFLLDVLVEPEAHRTYDEFGILTETFTVNEDPGSHSRLYLAVYPTESECCPAGSPGQCECSAMPEVTP